MAGITLSIEVADKGTVKIKQFADEAKKAMKEMTEAPKQAQGSFNSLRESWIGLTAKVAVATGIFYAAKRMIYDTAVQIASATNEIERQAAVLGISTDELQKWQYAAKMSDVNAQEFAIGIKLLSRNMEDASSGSGDAAKYFSAMGISVKTTQGHLRPLNDVMGDIMDKFASWEDGPRKIAIAMQLFGRSGETLIPLLNKGKTGFNELAEEARKLGIILSPELIQKGSQAEDIFKKINEQLRVAKLNWAPIALEVAKFSYGFLESVNIIKKWMDDNKTVVDFITGVLWVGSIPIKAFGVFKKKAEELRSEALMAWEPGPTPISGGKPPEIGAKKESDIVKEVAAAYESAVQQASEYGEVVMAQHELAELGWSREKDIVDQVREEIARLEAETNEWGEITIGRQELVEAGWKAAADAEADEIHELLELRKLEWEGWKEEHWKAGELEDIWKNVAENISSAWSSNMVNIIRSARSMTDKVKSFFQSIGDVFLSTISKMITQWLIFGSITGKKETGGGWATGGLWSGLLGSILKLQHGGIINQPTPAIIGEAGPEAVIPLKSGKIPIESHPTINVTNNIWTNDVDSFRHYLMANKDLLEGVALGAYAESKRLNKVQTR